MDHGPRVKQKHEDRLDWMVVECRHAFRVCMCPGSIGPFTVRYGDTGSRTSTVQYQQIV